MTDEQQYRVYTVIILDDEGEFTSLGSSVVEYSELTPVGVSFEEAQNIKEMVDEIIGTPIK